MASVGPTPQPGWYTDPQSPAQMRFWDGTGWTERTSPAAFPSAQAPGGQGWGTGPGQPQRGGFIASMFPQRPGESPDDALARGLASERIRVPRHSIGGGGIRQFPALNGKITNLCKILNIRVSALCYRYRIEAPGMLRSPR
jgi:hypothetical protein